jgi:hypothetical protein
MTKGFHEPPEPRTSPPGGADRLDGLFERARRDAFTPDESERLWQSLASAGPSGGGGTEGPGAPSPGGWASGVLVKVGLPLLVAGGLAVAVLSTRAPGPRGPTPATTLAAARAQETNPSPSQAGPPVIAFEDLPRAHAQEPSAQVPVAGHARRLEVAASPPAMHPAEPEPTEPGEPAEPAAPPPVETEVAAAPSEGALLLRARRQLATDPASALALTDEDANRFPSGALAPEREVLAIEALAQLGRLPEARTRFTAFRTEYPQSPHLARLATLVGL